MTGPIPVDEEDVLRRLNVSQHPTAFCADLIVYRARCVVCGGSEHGARSPTRAPPLRG